MKIKGAALLQQISYAYILIYGPPKSGKTESLITLLKLEIKLAKEGDRPVRPMWLFDFDRGASSLIRRCKEEGILEHLVVFRYDNPLLSKMQVGLHTKKTSATWQEFSKDFNALHDGVDAKNNCWKEGFDGPSSVAFDSFSSYQDILLDFVLTFEDSHDLGAKGTNSMRDYGRQQKKLVETVKSAQSLPCHSVFVAHEVLDKNEITGEIRIDPYVTGKLASRIGKEFDVVIYSKSDGGKFTWQMAPGGNVKTAGSRLKKDLTKVLDKQDYSLVI